MKKNIPDNIEDSPKGVPEELVSKVKGYMEPDRKKEPETISSSNNEPATAPPLLNVDDADAEPIIPTEKLAAIDQKNEVGALDPTPKEATTAPQPELNDSETDALVDDIVASEGDEILRSEDEKIASAFDSAKPSFGARVKTFFRAWWQTPKYRWATIILLALIGLGLGLFPTSRYFVLNSVGVRAGASVIVTDEKTKLPLKNVTVKLANQTSLTDDNGKAVFTGLTLGTREMVVEKRAFAPVRRTVTIGWGSNPLGSFGLEPVGVSYNFSVVDFMSDKPLEKVEASSGEASAFSNHEGDIVLVVDKIDDQNLEVNIQADGYRTETLTIATNGSEKQLVKLVPSRQHVFISKRSGKYDVYKIDVDGKNEDVLLPATGIERDDMTLTQHPTADAVALVSTRLNERNEDGFLLSSLTIIDIKSGESKRAALSERIQIIDWVGNKLVYVRVADGASASDSKRHGLVSYDFVTEETKELTSSNYFNDVLVAAGSIYYSPSSYNLEGDPGLYKISADGTNGQRILDKEVWNIFRTDYEKLSLSVQQEWYEYRLGEVSTTNLPGPPATLSTRVYRDSPDNTRSIWADERDGKGVLLLLDKQSKTEKVAQTQSGLNSPLQWLNNSYVVYRVNDGRQVADYVLNIDGGTPRKIKDVTSTSGIDHWYYY